MKPAVGTVLLNAKKQTVKILLSQLQTAQTTSLPLEWAQITSFLKPWPGPIALHLPRPVLSLPSVKSKLRREILLTITLTGLHYKKPRHHHKTRSSSTHQQKESSPLPCCLQVQTNPGILLVASFQRAHVILRQHRIRLATGQIWHSACPSVRPAASRPTASPRGRPLSERTWRAGGTLPGFPDKNHRKPDGPYSERQSKASRCLTA